MSEALSKNEVSTIERFPLDYARIPAYKSRTLILDHLFLEPRIYMNGASFQGQECDLTCLGGNKYDCTKS